MPKTSSYKFKAEVNQLLNILVHSLYANKDIFIREIISNASDALDKIRFEMNRGTETADPEAELGITVHCDPDNGVLTVTDTGVGMTREELISNIGTIARSGSARFIQEAAEAKDNVENIIGRFGVGFYSVFMAAGEVVLRTKSFQPDAPAVEWRSDGKESFKITELNGNIPRGTSVEIHLTEEAKEYAREDRVKAIIREHSSFISFPIKVGEERINTQPAIWREPKFNIAEEQYNDFYKFLTYDPDPPLLTIHVSVDAPVQYNTLLFVPGRSLDLPGMAPEPVGLDLYCQRVLIRRGDKDLIPEYLGFVRGVIDSEDLPLNINRETIQENALVRKIAANVTKQILSHLAKLAESDPDKYNTLWQTHGRLLRRGYNDFVNRDKFAELLRFNTSACADGEELVSLAQYADRVKDGQKEIYYAAGANRAAMELNPHLEMFRAKGLEVLYLYDPFDEFGLDALGKYKDFPFKSVERTEPGELDQFDQADEQPKSDPLSEEDRGRLDDFLARIKDILGDRVTEVKISSRLSKSPVCLASPDGSMTSSMEKVMRLVNQDSSVPAKVLEVNADHPLIRNLLSLFKNSPEDGYLALAVEHLFESVLLLEGYLSDPQTTAGRMQSLLEQSSAWRLAVEKK